MNSINRVIQDPLFFLVFVGALVAPAATVILAFVVASVLAFGLGVATLIA